MNHSLLLHCFCLDSWLHIHSPTSIYLLWITVANQATDFRICAWLTPSIHWASKSSTCTNRSSCFYTYSNILTLTVTKNLKGSQTFSRLFMSSHKSDTAAAQCLLRQERGWAHPQKRSVIYLERKWCLGCRTAQFNIKRCTHRLALS